MFACVQLAHGGTSVPRLQHRAIDVCQRRIREGWKDVAVQEILVVDAGGFWKSYPSGTGYVRGRR